MEHDTTVPDSPALQAYKAEQPQRIERTQDRLRAALLALDIHTVIADYDGGGDSGQFDQIHFYDAENNNVSAKVSAETAEQVESLLHDLLEARHGGWENNDGACGTFTWDLKEHTLEHEHNDRYTDYETSQHEGFDDRPGASEGDAQ